ncbi:MAG: hypothetical protein K6E36_03355 [Oscillospiraceae bacterium]|nr:hypothetical protein [Oscillospiraceae bacterium]
MKRTTAFLTAAVMLLSVHGASVPASAEEQYSGKLGLSLIWQFDAETETLSFSGSGRIPDYYDSYSIHIQTPV